MAGYKFSAAGNNQCKESVLTIGRTHMKSKRLRCGMGERLGLAEWHRNLSERRCWWLARKFSSSSLGGHGQKFLSNGKTEKWRAVHKWANRCKLGPSWVAGPTSMPTCKFAWNASFEYSDADGFGSLWNEFAFVNRTNRESLCAQSNSSNQLYGHVRIGINLWYDFREKQKVG